MRILVTGSSGFVGRNLVVTLKSLEYDVFEYDRDTRIDLLDEYTKKCDFVVHLAGVNRPIDRSEFYEGNANFTEQLVNSLKMNNNSAPILVSSSVQAELDNDYGMSKLQGENILKNHAQEMKSLLYIYRFTNIFGKWSRPNYNSVIATWCYNITRNQGIEISDPTIKIPFVYIDDVVNEIVSAINGKPNLVNGVGEVVPIHEETLGTVHELLVSYRESRESKFVPNVETEFSKKLYSTYLSFLPKDQFSYPLVTHRDDRGSFTEILKSSNQGQVSVNISKPGITKGQHWHHTKNEKFLVVSGEGKIQFRHILSHELIEYKVSSEKFEVVDIPVGYTHNIINTGNTEMITIMWANELFDPNNPDTFYEEV